MAAADALDDCDYDTSSVSSAESYTHHDFYYEEVVEEDGESELILLRRSRPAETANTAVRMH